MINMQAEYFWETPASDSLGHLMAQDIIDIITGETDVNNLSVDCDKTNSWIDTSLTTSPWTVHDAAAGTDLQIIKTTQADSGDTKFLGLDFTPGSSSAYFSFAVMSAWNEIAHTGTDYFLINTEGPRATMRTNFSAGGAVYIYASRECILLMQARYSPDRYGNYRTTNSDVGTLMVGEHTRGISTQIGDQPNWFVASLGNCGGKGDTSGTLQGGYKWSGRRVSTTNVTAIVKPYRMSVGLYTASIYSSEGNFQNYPEVLKASQARKQIGPVVPQSEDDAIQYKPEFILCGNLPYASGQDSSTIQGNVSLQCDIWKLPAGSGAIGSYMNWNGKKYRVWKSGDGTLQSGTTVGHKILVPLG
jgi:hypothetical protein